MMLTRRSFLLGTVGLASAAIVGCSEAAAPVELPTPPLLGDPNAPKRLVLWGSCTCPYTAMLLLGVLDGIVTSMPETVSLEWHHYPIHAPDPALHVAALSFKDAHFWGFTKRLLDHVLAAGGVINGLTPEKIAEFAAAEGGSEEAIAAAYADKAKWDAVKQDLIAGRLLGVTQTPGLFYNGYFLTPNGVPFDRAGFDKALRAMLQQA